MIPYRDNIRSRSFPVMTVLLIFANFAVFAYELALPARGLKELFWAFGVVPARLAVLPQLPLEAWLAFSWTLFTSMFLHGGFIHLIGNMLYLWVFGDNVEDRMGALRFLGFYLFCGLATTWLHILFNLDSRLPTIGASGAVAGVLGAYLVSYPYARVEMILPPFLFRSRDVPAVIVLLLWFFLQLFSGALSLGAPDVGGTAWWAHLGGFLTGILAIGSFSQRVTRHYAALEKDLEGF